MWLTARYLPVAPFSLKPAVATSSGGKTLLVMTPYAIKMALLDVAIRTQGIAAGEALFPALRDLAIAMVPPEDILVFTTFSKIWRPVESKDSQKKEETREEFDTRMRQKLAERMERGQYPFYSTISFREYVYYRSAFQLAFSAPDEAVLPPVLPQLLTGINYFGKRGGFAQLLEQPRLVEQLPSERFIELTTDRITAFFKHGTLQMLDDCAPTLTFQRANIYSRDRVSLDKERILHHVVLPYRLKQSSRGYNWYEAISEEG
jgi:hypothetical protein